MSPTVDTDLRAPASPGELFRAFTRLSLQGFGGVLPVAQHALVVRHRWLTSEQFVELLALGQVLPGPNIVNVAVMVGARFYGVRGAAAAFLGLLAAPALIVLTLTAAYGRLAQVPAIAGALRGVGAVAAGLVIATALRLSRTLRTNPAGPRVSALVGLATLAAVAGLRWPLVYVVVGVGGLSVLWAWQTVD